VARGMGGSIKYFRLRMRLVIGVLSLVFLINYWLQAQGISSAFTRNYLDDLLAMPIILYLTQSLMRLLYKNHDFKLDISMLILGFLMVSIGFEWVLPKYFEHLTSDFWDVLCYALGTVIFYFLNLHRTDNKE
jgi:hypothetical protein